MQLATALFVSPVIIFLSLIADAFSLPTLLMKPSSEMAHKYQFQANNLTSEQVEAMIYAVNLVFSKYDEKWKGTSITLLDLMIMHRVKFRLTDNLHDLRCVGKLDSREALANVQEYNLSKLLSTKCSIPDESGKFKLGRINVDVMFAIYKDAKLYNYADIVIRKIKMGTLRDQITEKENNSHSGLKQEDEPRALSEMQY